MKPRLFSLVTGSEKAQPNNAEKNATIAPPIVLLNLIPFNPLLLIFGCGIYKYI